MAPSRWIFGALVSSRAHPNLVIEGKWHVAAAETATAFLVITCRAQTDPAGAVSEGALRAGGRQTTPLQRYVSRVVLLPLEREASISDGCGAGVSMKLLL